jgi:hypothetical protein
MSEKMPVFKVSRPGYGKKFCVYRDGATLIDVEFSGAELGDVIHVELAEMTKDQLESLDEFEGW